MRGVLSATANLFAGKGESHYFELEMTLLLASILKKLWISL